MNSFFYNSRTILTTTLVLIMLITQTLALYGQKSQEGNASAPVIGILDEVQITPIYKDSVSRDDSLRLRGRILRTWEYATLAADHLQEIDHYRKGATKRDFRHTVNDTQKMLFSRYEEALKNMSRNDGRVLIKLVHRLTGLSAYEIARDLKSGWKAWWWNNAAAMFSLSLKREYAPLYVAEDRVIENIIKDFYRKGYIMYYPAHWENISYFYSQGDSTSRQMQKATSRISRKKERKAQRRSGRK